MPKLKIKTIALPAFEGKTLQEVYDYLKREFPQALPFDGVDFYDNDCLKDGKYHHFFGSVFPNSYDSWRVPYVHWDGSNFRRDIDWLANDWDDADCAVLLDPSEIVKTTVTLESLDKRVKKLEKKIK